MIPAQGASLPQLFHELPKNQSKFKAATLAKDRAAGVARVQLDTAVLGGGDFVVSLNGEQEIATRVDSYRRLDGETFTFRVADEKALSVATTFYSRPSYMHLVFGGKMYFISPEDDHYVIAPSRNTDIVDQVRYPAVSFETLAAAASTATCLGRCRPATHPSAPHYTIGMQGVLSTTYLSAVGDEQVARDRMAHMFDYTNAALRGSNFSDATLYLRDVVVMDLGAMETVDVSQWAYDNAELQARRFKNKACGTFLVSQTAHINQALRNGARKTNPRWNNAIVSGFFASWDDGDIESAGHELGHTLGMDHNAEDAVDASKDPMGYARGKYDCGRQIRDLMSYNRCNDVVYFLPLYSGTSSYWKGELWGSEAQDDVRAARNVAPFLDESQVDQ